MEQIVRNNIKFNYVSFAYHPDTMEDKFYLSDDEQYALYKIFDKEYIGKAADNNGNGCNKCMLKDCICPVSDVRCRHERRKDKKDIYWEEIC